MAEITIEEKLKLIIGGLVFQIATLQVQLDELQQKTKEDESPIRQVK